MDQGLAFKGVPSRIGLDLTEMPTGQQYEDRYRGYLEIFERIAKTPAHCKITVSHAPASWLPLLMHLNCMIVEPRCNYFAHDPLVYDAVWDGGRRLDRTEVEVLCALRPETVDALWKCDAQWNPPEGRVRDYRRDGEFIVTCNGSFWRPEVLEYLGRLEEYVPTKRKVVLVPCAADKPYPAPMHRAVLDRMHDDFYLMNVTGVVGLVPQDLWMVMPQYDSGIPNEWRAFEAVRRYFNKHEHDQIVVYCDFYSLAIKAALENIGMDNRAHYINEVKFYPDYLDLMEPARLQALSDKLDVLTEYKTKVLRF